MSLGQQLLDYLIENWAPNLHTFPPGRGNQAQETEH
jgi:hypothetical protein